MNVYVIRHGETEMGRNNLIATEAELLNEHGKQQAVEAGKELKKLKIDTIYCSPIERAKQTLELFGLDKNIPIKIENRLKERDMGIYDEAPFENLEWEEFWGYDSELKYKELESMKSVYKRVSEFLDEIKLKENNENILLVTHGGVSKAIYWYFNSVYESLGKCENCKIYQYTI